jgi:hypothetical protein
MRMLDRAGPLGDPGRIWSDGLAYAKEWQAAERRHWWGGA